jgi:farnesyl diphosphate synthase
VPVDKPFLAFDILARHSTHPDARIRAELVLMLARASGAGGMVGGQSLDLEASKTGMPQRPDIAHITRLQSMKTGALITCACEMGAILSGATATEQLTLRRYATALGAAFQIADDLLDAEGDASTAGKAVAKDAAAGKATLVGLGGIAAARVRLEGLEAETIAALAMFGERGRVLADAARFICSKQV